MSLDPSCIACPHCDVLHHVSTEQASSRMRCVQCGYVLTLGQPEAIARVTGLALTSSVLMFIVLFAPFLDLRAGSFESHASIIDVILGFASGIMIPLALAVLGFIVILPLARALLLVYALSPLVAGVANFPAAQTALRWAFWLKPWAMAEIFMVGVAVALVKLAGMASIEMGTAFWAFALLVAVNASQDTFMCRNTLWNGLNNNAH